MASKANKYETPSNAPSARGRPAAAKPLSMSASNVTGTTASSRAKQAALNASTDAMLASSEKRAARSAVASVTSTTKMSGKLSAPAKRGKAPPANAGHTPATRANKPVAVSEKPSSVHKLTSSVASATSTSEVEESGAKASVVDSKPDEAISSSQSEPPISGQSADASLSASDAQKPALTVDSLQAAAQVYPWLYMTSTLEACFQSAEEAAKKDLSARSNELDDEEAGLADARTRLEAERVIDFYDELATDDFSKEAPHIMQTFLSHGDACSKAETEALNLATNSSNHLDGDEPLKAYNDMLDHLEQLHATALELESSILRLTSKSEAEPPGPGPSQPDAVSARSQILGVFSACLPIIRARISNLTMAQDLIDGAQENLSLGLRMESLGLLD